MNGDMAMSAAVKLSPPARGLVQLPFDLMQAFDHHPLRVFQVRLGDLAPGGGIPWRGAGGSPRRFYSMSAQIRVERNAYYDILEATQKGDLDITRWLMWFLDCLDRAIVGAEQALAAVLQKAQFWERHTGETFNDRQRLMLNRLLNGFEGKLTSSKWALIAKTSQDTASRDIDDLLKRRILVKDPGGGRSTSYSLIITNADALRAVAAYIRAHKSRTAWSGARYPSEDEKAERVGRIEKAAEELDALAERAEDVDYRDFEAVLAKLHDDGMHPEPQLVSAVAFALRRDGE